MTLLLKNATIVNLDPPAAEKGSVLIENGKISNIGAKAPDSVPADVEVVDCTGKVLLPGLTIGHTHLYSALAPGMPPPKEVPETFVQILEQVWWKLDRALDEQAVYTSALVGAARAALCGVTTIIDHHASPNAIKGSLGLIQEALEEVGTRGVLCYEVTDRNGADGSKAGLEENDRYLASLQRDGRFAGLSGAHASFTLSEKSLRRVAEIAEQHETGVHIHVAEDRADVEDAFRKTGAGLIQRLHSAGVLRPTSILAHCTHLSPENVQRVRDAGCWMAHNTRSNMNNSVGYAPIKDMLEGNVALGTDGIDGDIFTESRTSFFKARDARCKLDWPACARMVTGASQLASQLLGVQIGKIEEGAEADLVLMNYEASTPITSDNVLGHWFFGFNARHVESVMSAGKWIVLDGQFTNLDVYREMLKASNVARDVWRRFEDL